MFHYYWNPIRDEDDQLLPQVGDTIEHRGQPWIIVDILPVTPDIDDPDHPEAAVDIVCEQGKAKEGARTTVPERGA